MKGTPAIQTTVRCTQVSRVHVKEKLIPFAAQTTALVAQPLFAQRRSDEPPRLPGSCAGSTGVLAAHPARLTAGGCAGDATARWEGVLLAFCKPAADTSVCRFQAVLRNQPPYGGSFLDRKQHRLGVGSEKGRSCLLGLEKQRLFAERASDTVAPFGWKD